MRLIDADALQLAIVEEGQANKRKKYIIGDIWELTGAEIREVINSQPTIQPEITHEQAVEYLQSTGWMREHDLQMMLDGVHRLTAQPEIVRCEDCKHGVLDDGFPHQYFCVFKGDEWNNADYFCSRAERREVTT